MEEVKATPPLRFSSLKQHNFYKIEDYNTSGLSKIKIVWCFFSFLVSVADVTVILYLSFLHFLNESQLVAWLMLLPILLNFIGMFTFLSNKVERREMESLGGKQFKNWMFFPVIGPSVSAFRLCVYAFQETNVEKFERLESLLLRMRQYESYFRAAPEAFIQIAARVFNYSAHFKYHVEDYWTSACIVLCIFSLAESHMYAGINKYYRMFSYDPTENLWRTGNIQRKWRLLLFAFTFFSINSRIIADSLQKATACFFFTEFYSFGEVIMLNLLFQFVVRAAIYGIYNSWLGSPKRKLEVEDEGVYGAFTYSWRCLFLSLDFQSNYVCVFCWFYIENFIMVYLPYILIYLTPWFNDSGDNALKGRYIFHVYAALATIQMILAILIKFGVRYHWKRKQGNQILDSN